MKKISLVCLAMLLGMLAAGVEPALSQDLRREADDFDSLTEKSLGDALGDALSVCRLVVGGAVGVAGEVLLVGGAVVAFVPATAVGAIAPGSGASEVISGVCLIPGVGVGLVASAIGGGPNEPKS